MATFSYPKPKAPLSYVSVDPRPLYSLSTPRTSSGGPALPREAAQRTTQNGVILPGYKFGTHIFRAASPRTKCTIGPTPTFPVTLPNRKQAVLTAAKHLGSIRSRELQSVYEEGWPTPENELWIVVNRFMSERLQNGTKNRGGVTMIFMHANGFHKETWEESLRATVRLYPNFNETVDEIWLLDSVNHGDSAIINEGRLGDIFNWQDNARDILQFLLYYLPETPGSTESLHLKVHPQGVVQSRKRDGIADRRLVGMGHSLGGTSILRAAMDTPILFSDLLLVDPVIHCPAYFDAIAETSLPLSATVGRRVDFPSRQAALESFLKVPFFNRWDRRVLQAYVDFAMVEDPITGGVKLKTSGYQEAAVFSERRLAMEVWEMLVQLDKRVELRWIMAGQENGLTGGDDGTPDSAWQRASTVWRREENCSNVRIKGSGHLITQIAPDALGREIGSYVLDRYSKGQAAVSKL